MLRGRFGDTSGRPYLEGRLILPRLNIQCHVSFLVDTGADLCLLLPSDSVRMNIDFDQLTGDQECVGTSGPSHSFVETAIVIFSEPKRFLYVYYIDLLIAPYDSGVLDLSSLLGRNILDRWRMIYDPVRKRLAFNVLSADSTITIP